MADRAPKAPEAHRVEDPAMEARLREVYAGFDAEVGYMVDRVALTIPRERIADAARVAKDDERLRIDYLGCLSVAEYEESFQAVYVLWSTTLRHGFALKTNAPKDDPAIPSVTPVWRGADWHEREGAELFGVTFTGHPNPGFLLLFDEFEGKHPLRKDYPFEETDEWDEDESPSWETPRDDEALEDRPR